MTKTKLIFIGLALALVGFLFAGSASAQDQTLTADPSAVSEAGTYDFTLTPSGFTASWHKPCHLRHRRSRVDGVGPGNLDGALRRIW